MGDKEIDLVLVNLSPVAQHEVIVQAGSYGEHRFTEVTVDGKTTPINGSTLTVELAPGAERAAALRR